MTSAYERAQDAQRIAAQPDINVFVTANAGSGKTKVLVDRIARLLLTGAAPSTFLCITYTKAAAAEMQRRLFERLGDWCIMSDDALAAALKALIGETLAEPPLAQARGLFARALEAPGGLKIQTIHGFCERLLRRFPFESGVAPGFDIADEVVSNELIERAWRRAMAQADQQLSEAVDLLASRMGSEALSDLRTHLMAQRSVIRHQLAQGLERALESIHEKHAAPATAAMVYEESLGLTDWRGVEAWIKDLAQGSANDLKLRDGLATALEMHTAGNADALAVFDALRSALLTQKFELRSAYVTKSLQKEAPGLDGALRLEAERVLKAQQRLFAIDRRDESLATMRLAHALIEGYAREKAFSGLVDFEDLISAANGLLVERDAAGWVLYKLDGGLEHILIDEGQDTNPDQWSLIAPLQNEFFAGHSRRVTETLRPRTVFAVGDPKQSIYGFQGAEPERFLQESQALDARARAAGGQFFAPSLEMSFRSTQEVLRAVDATLSVADVGTAPPGVFDKMAHTAFRESEGGVVEWWPVVTAEKRDSGLAWDAPLDQERSDASHVRLCEMIAREVRDWISQSEAVWEKGRQRAMRPGDIMALVRSRGVVFQQLLKAFKREGLPVAGADRMRLADETAVQDMLALARVALDPGDDLSLACVLKGPFVGLYNDDSDLFPLAYGRARGERVFDRLLAAPDRFAEARAFVLGLLERRHDHPHRFFSTVLESLDQNAESGWTRMLARLGVAARDPLDEFLSRALNAGALGVTDLHAFVHRLENDGAEVKRQQDDSLDAIAIMTAHGAKGLEKPVVILPQTTDAPKTSPDKRIIIDRNRFIMLSKQEHDDAYANAARADYGDAAHREHLRLLYVAMTRARDRLIVCGYAKRNSALPPEKSWHTMVGAAMEKIGDSIKTPAGDGFRLGARAFAPTLSRPSAQETSSMAPAWARARAHPSIVAAPSRPSGEGPALSPRRSMQKRLSRGRLIHGLLQRLPDVAPELRRQLGAQWLARQPESADLNADQLLHEALGVLSDDRFAAVFGEGSRAEAPITAQLANGRAVFGIVDRLVVGAASCLVLDYKTDRPPPDDIADAPERILRQMAEYRAALRTIFPDRLVQTGVLWTMTARLDAIPDSLLDRYES